MVLLQIHILCFTIRKLKSDAPWPVNVDAIAPGLVSSKSMKVKARHIQISRNVRLVQHIENHQRASLKSRAHFPALTRVEQRF